jgi:hypothetical protein
MLKRGEGPDVAYIASMPYVTPRAEDEWLERITRPTREARDAHEAPPAPVDGCKP